MDASYNPVDDVPTLDDAVKYEIRIGEEKVGVKVRIESKRQTRLSNLNAVHVVYTFKADGQPMICEEVIALRNNERSQPLFLYTLGMQTTPQFRTGNTRIWTQVVSGFNNLPFEP